MVWFWQVEVQFKPNLVYGYNMGTFICSWGQRSHIKVKGHLRSSCKIAWKLRIWLIYNKCGNKVRCQPALFTNPDNRQHYRSLTKMYFIRNVPWSRGMSQMLGILILSYRLKEVINSSCCKLFWTSKNCSSLCTQMYIWDWVWIKT